MVEQVYECEEEDLKCIRYVMGVSAGFGGCG